MRATIVCTLIGADRPGLVEAVSEALSSHGANWEESRMASLAGKFAGILQATVPAEQLRGLTTALRELERDGLHVTVERSDQPAQAAAGHRLVLELLGQDHPGIVRDVSRVLAEAQVNVEELTTACEHASMAGGDLFRARVLLSLPLGMEAETLRRSLEGLADELMVDVSFSEEPV